MTRRDRPEGRKSRRPRTDDAQTIGRMAALRLDVVVDEYERDLRRREITPHTIRNYHKVLDLALRYWRERLGRPPTLDDFTLRAGEAFVDHLLDRGRLRAWAHGGEARATDSNQPSPTREGNGALSVESVRCYVRTLKAFSAWLAAPKQGYTPEHRLALLATPRKSRMYKRPLDARELQALVDACDVTSALGSRDLALLLLFLDGGLRAGEICALRVCDVNLEDGQVFIARGKGRKSRLVSLGADTTRLLARYAVFRDALADVRAPLEAPFFQTIAGNSQGFTYEALRKWLIRLKARAGVERAFLHLLRHTSAVRTLEVPGSDLYTLQEKLGHSDVATTLLYLNMTSERLAERQRSFSPVDHLGLEGLMRLVPPEQTDGRLFHRPNQRRAPAGTPSMDGRKRGPSRDNARRRHAHDEQEGQP